jgi:hypothetical protein
MAKQVVSTKDPTGDHVEFPERASHRFLEEYLSEVNAIRASGAGVAETSYYPALSNLFNAVGKTLKPRVRCLISINNQGAGLPDGGLFTAEQFQRQASSEPKPGQLPARGAIEVKGTKLEILVLALSQQVRGYLATYGIVIVTNLRAFAIMAANPSGAPETMESFSLADNEAEFWQEKAAHPRRTAQVKGDQFVEFIRRACLHNAPLANPKDVAWFLASYARDALFRMERQRELPALQTVRWALEEALGMKFAGEKGEHFFRSTLVQTLFYGVFSAWVSWHKSTPGAGEKFNWKQAEWSLHVPFIKTLYEEVAKPSRLGALGLVEVLDWSAGVLNRVDRSQFFGRFEEENAVQYFYEPFLESYDPELRKELGVWYTPREIVKYQVARVDTVLREELDLRDGLADPKVIVLDPCCGTGAYLVEVLHRIAATLRAKGGDALVASDLKQAATERVFGFEILPAPFVVSHLQLGLLLQREGAPFSQRKKERAGVYLTNALTGWEPPKGPKQHVMHFAELEEERDAAEHVKRDQRILVVLGNPPYNAFAGVSPQEEQGLVEVYKSNLNKPAGAGGWGIKKFNLDDLYVRFFRLAERRIAEMSGKGVVSFISNQSWVSEPSFVVLRQHLLESFDKFWIENLHGNRKISEYAPDGKTSETVFAISGFSVGIQQGVATSLWVRHGNRRKGAARVRFRDDIDAAKAEERRKDLLQSLDMRKFNAAYALADPRPENRFSFRPETVAAHYNEWPKLTELCAVAPFNGPVERRGNSLIRFVADAEGLNCVRDYLDSNLDDEQMRRIEPRFMLSSGEFRATEARKTLQGKTQYDPRQVVRYPFKPFDVRVAYLDGTIQPLFSRPSPQLLNQRFAGNAFFITRDTADKFPEGPPFFYSSMVCDYDSISGHARHFPIRLINGARLEREAEATLFAALGEKPAADAPVANLSARARGYAVSIKAADPDTDRKKAALLWMHALAVGYSPAYLTENSDGLRRDWPRIPLPDSRKALEASAALGEQVAALLDSESEVPGVTSGRISSLLKTVGLITKTGGGQLDAAEGDLAVSVGWGHFGKGGVTMPAKGKLIERQYDAEEAKAMCVEAAARHVSAKDARRSLGERTCDVYLNGVAYWRNIPLSVWDYHIGGYQVIKKWLSYREDKILGRALWPEEAREVTNMARRIAAIILLQPKLDENYLKIKSAAFDWSAAGE